MSFMTGLEPVGWDTSINKESPFIPYIRDLSVADSVVDSAVLELMITHAWQGKLEPMVRSDGE